MKPLNYNIISKHRRKKIIHWIMIGSCIAIAIAVSIKL